MRVSPRCAAAALPWAVVLALWIVPVLAETELVLVDGRILRGSDVRRDGGDYVLTLETGDEVTLPVALVEEIRLTGSADEPGDGPGAGQTLAGGPVPEGPSGLRQGEPETLAGEPAQLRSRSEQLEVFGPPARFRGDVVDNRWQPETDWEMDRKQNDFNPSTWAEAPIDPTWTPESAFDADDDVLEPSRSTWQESIIDSNWSPTDGFRTGAGRR